MGWEFFFLFSQRTLSRHGHQLGPLYINVSVYNDKFWRIGFSNHLGASTIIYSVLCCVCYGGNTHSLYGGASSLFCRHLRVVHVFLKDVLRESRVSSGPKLPESSREFLQVPAGSSCSASRHYDTPSVVRPPQIRCSRAFLELTGRATAPGNEGENTRALSWCASHFIKSKPVEYSQYADL